MDALYQPAAGLDIKTATGTDCYPSQIRSGYLAFGHNGPDQISRLESEDTFAPRGKPCFVSRVL